MATMICIRRVRGRGFVARHTFRSRIFFGLVHQRLTQILSERKAYQILVECEIMTKRLETFVTDCSRIGACAESNLHTKHSLQCMRPQVPIVLFATQDHVVNGLKASLLVRQAKTISACHGLGNLRLLNGMLACEGTSA